MNAASPMLLTLVFWKCRYRVLLSAIMRTTPLYPAYLPTRPDGPQPLVATAAFDIEEPGLRAQQAKRPSIFESCSKAQDITPKIGTEIRGIQLSSLSKSELDEVALAAAKRGVLVFVSGSQALLINVVLLIRPCPERSRLCRHWFRQAARDSRLLWSIAQGKLVTLRRFLARRC